MKNKKDTLKDKNISDKSIDILKNKIKNKDIQIKKLKLENDKILRSLADLQNIHKRNEKQYESDYKTFKKKYLIQLIDIFDLLKNANNDKNPKHGIKLIINQIEKILEDENIKYIDCIGKSFDHKIHHAITTIEKNDCDDETIIEELKKGYFINNDLLRPSQVIVSKKK